MIRGLGIDLVSEKQVKGWLAWSRARLDKVLAPCEVREMADRGWGARHLAARVAAKEALFKATGVSFRPFEAGVVRERGHPPAFWLSERLATLLEGTTLHLSLSHAGGMAMACVVATD